jgi:hypothetical protein
MLFKKMIIVYTRIVCDPLIQNTELLIGKAGGTYSSHLTKFDYWYDDSATD